MRAFSKFAVAGFLIIVAFGCSGGSEPEAAATTPPANSGPPTPGPDGKELTPQGVPGSGAGSGAASSSMTNPPPPTN